jgi:hypothetical protein
MPAFAFMKSEKEIVVNFYCESEASIEFKNGNNVSIKQKTSYPENGKIELIVNPEFDDEFALKLRIPEWSKQNTIKVNGKEIAGIEPGTYTSLIRKWQKGDRIELQLDMRGRLIKQDDYQAILYGPIVLARDTRFNDGFIDETSIIQNNNGIIELRSVENVPENIWMAYTAPLVLGTDLEGEMKKPRQIHFCDFSSAGNTWDSNTRYRVWLRETLNVMKVNYQGYQE